MRPVSHCAAILCAAALVALTGAWGLAPEEKTSQPAAREPAPVAVRGKLVCLAEELRDAHRAGIPPVHDHILALRVEGAAGEAPEYYALLRTSQSQALFSDERFKAHTLVLTGRVFPGTRHLEVSRFQWLQAGKLEDVYYWCEVCSIRGVDPGPCACCQGAVELRQAPAADGGATPAAKASRD